MKKSVVAMAVAVAALVGGVSIATAGGETAEINYNVKGKFSPKKFKPAQLTFGINVSTPEAQISPLKQANLTFPPSKTMQFVPNKKVKKCGIKPFKSAPGVGVPPAAVYKRCGKSVIGNGVATFQLAQVNEVDNPAFALAGVVVVVYGGKVGKDHKIIFLAWSDDTNAGVYAQGVLRKNGKMDIAMPRLTSDSSVTSLNLAIPGTVEKGEYVNGNTYSLRKGMDSKFVRVKCRQNSRLNFKANLALGSRFADGRPDPDGGTTNLAPTSFSNCGS